MTASSLTPVARGVAMVASEGIFVLYRMGVLIKVLVVETDVTRDEEQRWVSR